MMRTVYQMLLVTAGTVMVLPMNHAHAQTYPNSSGINPVDAVILHDLSEHERERRDAQRRAYAGPDAGAIGTIHTAPQARKACANEALAEAGAGVKIVGKTVARTMSTGWEVEGGLDAGVVGGPTSFVCSVRNGSVTGVLLRR